MNLERFPRVQQISSNKELMEKLLKVGIVEDHKLKKIINEISQNIDSEKGTIQDKIFTVYRYYKLMNGISN